MYLWLLVVLADEVDLLGIYKSLGRYRLASIVKQSIDSWLTNDVLIFYSLMNNLAAGA